MNVVFCDKKYMLLFLTFQICDRITNYGYDSIANYHFLASTQSNIRNMYCFYVAYDVQYTFLILDCVEAKNDSLQYYHNHSL